MISGINGAQNAGMMSPTARGCGPGSCGGLEQKFNTLDADGSGGLDATEFQALADKVGQFGEQNIDVDQAMTEYDTDGNGQLDQAEVASMMKGFHQTLRMGGADGASGASRGGSKTPSQGVQLYQEQSLVDLLMPASDEEPESYLSSLA